MGDNKPYTLPIGSISEMGSVLLKKTMAWKSGGGQDRREMEMGVVEKTPMDSDSDEVPAPPFPPKMMSKKGVSLKVVTVEVDGGGPAASKAKGKGKEKAQPPLEDLATEPDAEIPHVKSRPEPRPTVKIVDVVDADTESDGNVMAAPSTKAKAPAKQALKALVPRLAVVQFGSGSGPF